MRDEWFIRGDTPMTKSEVRAVSLSKLELNQGAILWDVGSGTGSVSVEAALCHPVKKVCAFEQQESAAKLLIQNREKAGLSEERLPLILGSAPESFPDKEELSRQQDIPTHAFLGGTSKKADQIIGRLLEINPGIRIVMNVISLESLSGLMTSLGRRGIEAEIVMLQVSTAKKAGTFHLMQGQNPIYIIAFGGEGQG